MSNKSIYLFPAFIVLHLVLSDFIVCRSERAGFTRCQYYYGVVRNPLPFKDLSDCPSLFAHVHVHSSTDGRLHVTYCGGPQYRLDALSELSKTE